MLGYQILWDEQMTLWGYDYKDLLVESRGIYDPLLDIVEELYHLVNNTTPTLIGSGYYKVEFRDYPINTPNIFLGKLKLFQVFYGKNVPLSSQSGFVYNDNENNNTRGTICPRKFLIKKKYSLKV